VRGRSGSPLRRWASNARSEEAARHEQTPAERDVVTSLLDAFLFRQETKKQLA
jgi:hypothetical protein